jgi:hypothetical protein
VETDTGTAAAIVRRHRNLVGIPSYHYDPVFGRIAHEVIDRERPGAVALELPTHFRPLLEWGAECWPDAVAAICAPWVLPLVPGDSILEAFRAAGRVKAFIELVDLDTRDGRRHSQALPGAELADRSGGDFFEVADAIAAGDPVDAVTLAREAVMARRLADLMGRHEVVVWVGGLAHWTRIVGRLECGEFTAPRVPVRRKRHFERARLDASALLRLTNNWPALIRGFADAPSEFDAGEHVRRLLQAATRADLDEFDGPSESKTAIDVARTGLYARNLAATSGLRELPALTELLQAAHSTIGPSYAARVCTLAMQEEVNPATASLDALTFEVNTARRKAGLRFRGGWLALEPWNPSRHVFVRVPDLTTLSRAARDAQYDELPGPRARERFYWGAYPADEAEWEAFVQDVLRRASVSDPGEGRAVPFSSGLEDGIDVRATIRHWSEDALYVRQDQRGRMNVTNGAIDWSSATEDADILQGRREGGGWNDPDSAHVGSASRELEDELISRSGDARVVRRVREWSVITLDSPTYVHRPKGRATFYDAVINAGLLKVQGRPDDNVYAWLAAMFRFCTGKPFVYYSRYVPGPRIRALAREHDVELAWLPLHRIPQELLRRQRRWRQLWLAESQWETLQHRIDAAKSGQWELERHVALPQRVASGRSRGRRRPAPGYGAPPTNPRRPPTPDPAARGN